MNSNVYVAGSDWGWSYGIFYLCFFLFPLYNMHSFFFLISATQISIYLYITNPLEEAVSSVLYG